MKNIIKAPLTAIIFASLMHFINALLPYSQGYRETLVQLAVSPSAYTFLILQGLCVSAAIALALGYSRFQGWRAVWPISVALLFTVVILPWFNQIGNYTSEVITRSDRLLEMAAVGAGCFVFFVLSLFFFESPEPVQLLTAKETALELKKKLGEHQVTKEMVREAMQQASKQNAKAFQAAKIQYKFNFTSLLVKILLLPLLYGVLAYIAWYFLSWRVEAVRTFFSGSNEYLGMNLTLVNLLLERPGVLPLTIFSGFLYVLCLLPLSLPLADNRMAFVSASVLFCLSGALHLLFPDVVLPSEVRLARLLEQAVLLVVYGGISGILLHTSLRRIVPVPKQKLKEQPTSDLSKVKMVSRGKSIPVSQNRNPSV